MTTRPPAHYGRLILAVAGLGGMLYGIDVGIIAAALLYLGKTVNLTVAQTSLVVAAVLGGSMCSSLAAGVLADWLGRKKMMAVSGLLFVASVGLIVLSQGFGPLLIGRLLQGVSGGVIAVVVPLYLAESLSAAHRGRGTALFQFMLTLGIVVAAVAGWFYTRQAEAAIALAGSDLTLIRAAQNHAWRGMFLSVVYPGVLFFLGTLLLSETPRWLFRKGRRAEALAALRRSSPEPEAQLQMREMDTLTQTPKGAQEASGPRPGAGSLLQRRYVFPFVLACLILAANQATGINSILGFLVLILKQAGMTARNATLGDVLVKVLNCVMTVVAIALVDRKGRKFLLKLGTGGIVLALFAGAAVFYTFESQRIDVRQPIERARTGNTLRLAAGEPFSPAQTGSQANPRPTALSVLYSYGHGGEKLATLISTDRTSPLEITPEATDPQAPLHIKQAFLTPVPTERTGWLVLACLSLFIASYSTGPGVVVWLALTELMPTRIRSTGMGIALLLNQGVSTLIAAVFLPVVGRFGYFAMFAFWAGCTVLYFLTAALLLPETKGKTLEEIETYFDRTSPQP